MIVIGPEREKGSCCRHGILVVYRMRLEVQQLSKRFGDLAALSNVSFQVRAGEVLGLIGPNGAGKTTLFECMAGVLPADGGEVRGPGGRVLAPAARKAVMFY